MNNSTTSTQLMDIAARFRGMREILGYSTQKNGRANGGNGSYLPAV